MKKSWLFTLMTLLLIPTALADITGTLGNVWDKIIQVGDLSLLGLTDTYILAAVTRILIWVLMFTIFFALINSLGGQQGRALSFLGRNHAIVIAAVVATIAAIFLPVEVLLATGAGWATAIALILIGGPVVGIGYLLLNIPGQGEETRGTIFLKLIICCLLFWILSVMKVYLVGIA